MLYPDKGDVKICRKENNAPIFEYLWLGIFISDCYLNIKKRRDKKKKSLVVFIKDYSCWKWQKSKNSEVIQIRDRSKVKAIFVQPLIRALITCSLFMFKSIPQQTCSDYYIVATFCKHLLESTVSQTMPLIFKDE